MAEYQRLISNLIPGEEYIVRVRSVNANNIASEWNDSIILDVPDIAALPNEGLLAVGNISVIAGIRMLFVRFDANTQRVLDGYNIYVSDVSGFTADSTTLVKEVGPETLVGVAQYASGGTLLDMVSGSTYYLKIRTRAVGGSLSEPTAEFSGIPGQVDNNTIESMVIDKLDTGNLNSIMTLNTGQIQTADTGTRFVFDNNNFIGYRSDETEWFNFALYDAATPSVPAESVTFTAADGSTLTIATGIEITGSVAVSGTIDGRDIAVDGSKLDGIESGADVTDAANVETAIEAITLTSITGDTGDEILVVDATDGELKAVLWENLPAVPVDSVNGQTGTVVLDADDIDDTSTAHKFVTATDITNLSNLSGTNTGDQDLSSYQLKPAEGAFADGDKTKLDYISVTQAVDLDTIETRVNQLDAAVVLQGSWDASSGSFPGSGSAQAGDSYIVSVAGTVDSVSFSVNDRLLAIVDNASTTTFASNWLKLDYTDQVLSVNTQTGAVVLDADDISDTSTTNKFTTAADITKLAGIETGATADQTAADIRGLGFFDTTNDGTGSGLDADLLDGNHASAFATAAQGSTADSALQNVVEDATPHLGGALDVNGHEIIGAIDLHSTGDIINELGDAAGVNKLSVRDSAAVEVASIDSDGNFSAATKSFDIPHPTKESVRLRYGSVEAPEHSVQVRGRCTSNIIKLPDYWKHLVDASTITVQLTAIGYKQPLFVKWFDACEVHVGGSRRKDFFYTVSAERTDVPGLVVEYGDIV